MTDEVDHWKERTRLASAAVNRQAETNLTTVAKSRDRWKRRANYLLGAVRHYRDVVMPSVVDVTRSSHDVAEVAAVDAIVQRRRAENAEAEVERLKLEVESDGDTMRLDQEARDSALQRAERAEAEVKRLKTATGGLLNAKYLNADCAMNGCQFRLAADAVERFRVENEELKAAAQHAMTQYLNEQECRVANQDAVRRLEAQLQADTRSLDALAEDATRMIIALVNWMDGEPDPEIRQAIVNIVEMACEAALRRRA